MLTDFRLVLIIQQTFSKCLWCARHHSREGSYCCYCVFERTWSYIVYFQRPSFAVGDPQTCGQETLCSSLNASQMGSHHCHVPVPASEAEGTDMAERCSLTLGRHGVGTPLATFSRLAPAVWGWPLSLCTSGTTEGNETPSRDPWSSRALRPTPCWRWWRTPSISWEPLTLPSFSSFSPFFSLLPTYGLGRFWILQD